MQCMRSFSCLDGSPIAILDGTELTRRRTAAASALAARFLARPEASRLLMVGHRRIGTAYHRHLYDRASDHRGARLGREPAARAAVARPFRRPICRRSRPSTTWKPACAGPTSSVVQPWPNAPRAGRMAEARTAPGSHRLVYPAMREVDDEALARSRIYVDTREGALAESGELLHGSHGLITAADICGDLSALIRGTVSGRRGAEEITLFKSVGCAIEDLAAAELAHRRASRSRALRAMTPASARDAVPTAASELLHHDATLGIDEDMVAVAILA